MLSAGLAAGAALTVGVAGAALAQQRGHEHGVVRLDAALDGAVLTLALEAPLDSLLGFERAPRGQSAQQLRRPATRLAWPR